jgi:hypothetical protein
VLHCPWPICGVRIGEEPAERPAVKEIPPTMNQNVHPKTSELLKLEPAEASALLTLWDESELESALLQSPPARRAGGRRPALADWAVTRRFP